MNPSFPCGPLSLVCMIHVLVAVLVQLFVCPVSVLCQLPIDTFAAAVSSNEISAFESAISSLAALTLNDTVDISNEYAQGHSHFSMVAMTRVYDISGSLTVLNKMIQFADTMLINRNDLASSSSSGRMICWTGDVCASWRGNDSGTSDSAAGAPVGHIADTARSILRQPAIWSRSVSDPHGFGSTYLARAQRYVSECEFSLQTFFFPHLLQPVGPNTSRRLYFSRASPYMSGGVFPWNQQMMMLSGLQALAECHQILTSNATNNYTVNYDAIVKANLNWFFDGAGVTHTLYTDSNGRPAYNWGYNPTIISNEDSNHGSLDVDGFVAAYDTHRYGITDSMMQPFANTFIDVMTLGHRNYSGQVSGTSASGHSAMTTYVRTPFVSLAAWRSDDFANLMGQIGFVQGSTTSSVNNYANYLRAKNQLYGGVGFPTSATTTTTTKPSTSTVRTTKLTSTTKKPAV